MVAKFNINDYIGKKFNKLTVLKDVGRDKSNHLRVEVQCDCEDKNIFITLLSSVKNGYTKSCGCLQKQVIYDRSKKYNTYDLTGEYGIGYDCNNKEFYFDLEDYNSIKEVCWYTNPRGYITGKHKDRTTYIHNLIMNNLEVDHIYHNKNDNRKENLRLVTQQQNNFNTKGKGILSKFGVKGINWSKTGKRWDCRIMKNRKIVYRNYFKNITDAIPNKIEAEKIHFGEHRYVWEHDIKWDLLLEYEKELKGGVAT